MADLADLERRVSRLEAAQNDNTGTLKWIAGEVGKLSGEVAVLKDDVKELKSDVRDLKEHVHRFEGEFNTFRREFPGQIAEVMREVLREKSASGE